MNVNNVHVWQNWMTNCKKCKYSKIALGNENLQVEMLMNVSSYLAIFVFAAAKPSP